MFFTWPAPLSSSARPFLIATWSKVAPSLMLFSTGIWGYLVPTWVLVYFSILLSDSHYPASRTEVHGVNGQSRCEELWVHIVLVMMGLWSCRGQGDATKVLFRCFESGCSSLCWASSLLASSPSFVISRVAFSCPPCLIVVLSTVIQRKARSARACLTGTLGQGIADLEMKASDSGQSMCFLGGRTKVQAKGP